MKNSLLVVVDNDQEAVDDVEGCVPVGHIDETLALRSQDEFNKIIKRGRNFNRIPGIFFVDLRMESKTSGIEILSYIRRSPRFRSVPVVIISNSEEEADISAAYSNGANMYLHKTDEPEGFPNSIRALLEIWTSTGRLPGPQ